MRLPATPSSACGRRPKRKKSGSLREQMPKFRIFAWNRAVTGDAIENLVDKAVLAAAHGGIYPDSL
ncbi:MAG TPA: hypothetical protein VFR18_07340 [Terriglobia bacterium]|nr:hypothetical protein [Terriglobia bacterium]